MSSFIECMPVPLLFPKSDGRSIYCTGVEYQCALPLRLIGQSVTRIIFVITIIIIIIIIIIILHPCCDCGWYVWFWIIELSFVLEQTCLFLMFLLLLLLLLFLLLLLPLLFCFLSTRQNEDEYME